MKNNWTDIKNAIIRLKDLSQMQFANFFAAGIFAIFWFYVASILGSGQYGQVNYYIATANLVSLISNVGASSAIVVYVAKKIKIEATLYLISIISSIIGALILFVLIHNTASSILVLGLVISSIATSEILGNKLYKTYSKYLITQKILGIMLGLGFNYFIGFEGIIIGISLSYIPYSLRIYKGFRETKIDFSILRSRFGFMINSYILNALSAFSNTIDRIIIAPLLGFDLLGNYALGLQVQSLLILFSTTVYEYIIPQDASGITNRKLRNGTIFISIILTITGLILSPIVIPILFPKFQDSIIVIQILSLTTVPQTISMMYNARFIGYEKNKIAVIGTVIYMTVQIPAIILLGHNFGVSGAAAGMLFASIIGCVYLTITNRRFNKKGIFS